MDRPLVVLHTHRAARRGAPHLVELGAVRLVEGEVEGHFSSLLRPQVPVEPEAEALHGIDESLLGGAREAREVLERFSDWAAGDWLFAHGAREHAEGLAYELARCGLAERGGPLLDSLVLARGCLPEAPDLALGALAGWLGLERTPRGEGTRAGGRTGARGGRALDCAVAAAGVVDACAETLGGWGAVEEALLLARAGPPLTLAAAGPGRPKGGARTRALTRAAASGASVALAYGGPEGPPARIRVAPRFCYRRGGRDYLEALAESSGQLKTYRLDRVHRVGEAHAERT